MHEDRRDGGRIDRAIDRAVRAMVEADPRPGLRHRVARQLDTPARARSWLLPGLGALTACAMVVLSLTLFPTTGSRQPVPHPQAASGRPATPVPPVAASRAAAPVAPVAPVAAEPVPLVRQSPTRRTAVFGPRTGRVAAASLEIAGVPDERGRTAIDAPSPDGATGVVSPLDPIVVAPITVAPIAISPVAVTALPIRR